ncbi:serine carboxypeptidase [Apodospora peruviana]|uniref:Serine carboxypeptidase n=1 Tax=Apodospora peruviana TaxID=516989 RepID=A0AAE0I4E0_9PEZI|nr:serine carboxypeptidase [Apodospora peruviana]
MRWTHASPLLGVASSVLATLNLKHFHPDLVAEPARQTDPRQYVGARDTRPVGLRQQAQPLFLTDQTKKFAINGSGIPEVNFDIGESYAGLLPIEGNDTSNELFFWFFPSTNPAAQESKEILIWLTGGPGCSSVGELMQSNGPFVWQPGVFKPFANKWSWHHLTNVVWIDQPIGTGFSHGNVTARDEVDVARQFLGFWKNFVDTFALRGYKVYVTGSSYSGMYAPYISSAMLDENDKTYFNVTGMMIFDGLYSKEPVSTDVPVASFVSQYKDIFAFNNTFSETVQAAADQCGYTDYMKKYLVFPANETQPAALPGQKDDNTAMDGCALFENVYLAAVELNPCFSVYTIADRCPLVYDPLGFAAGTFYVPEGSGPVFMDREDVKRAINAPVNQTWEFCTSGVFVNDTDNSLNSGPGSQPQLISVIERTQNVILGHGSQDFVLIADGSLLTIQNMTWGGKLGFQERPTAPLYIPYHDGNDEPTTLTGAGVVGTAHTERGLTYFGVAPAGHFLTSNQPAVAFRALEILLGKVENFQSTVPFSNDKNATVQPEVNLGNGTVFAGFVDRGFEIAGTGDVNETGKVLGSGRTGASSLTGTITAGAERKTIALSGLVATVGLATMLL